MVQLSGGILTPLEVKYQLENWNQNRSAVVIGATSTIFTAAFVSVLLRLAVRWKQRLRLQCDDYLIVVALVLIPSPSRLLVCLFVRVLRMLMESKGSGRWSVG